MLVELVMNKRKQMYYDSKGLHGEDEEGKEDEKEESGSAAS